MGEDNISTSGISISGAFNLHADRDRLVDLYNLRGDRVLGDIATYANIVDPPEILRAAKNAGLGALYVPDAERHERGWMSGTVYVYDRDRLQQKLDQNSEMLKKAEWPQQADAFVRHLSFVTAPVNSEIFDFIARCHDVKGDDPGRKPVVQPDPFLAAQQQGIAQLSKMRYEALQQNNPAAAKSLQAEASKGHMGAMLDTSVMYARGAGVKQDYAEAAFWSGLVARMVIPEYRRMLEGNDPAAKIILGPDVKPGDSDAAISAASARGNLRDAVKLRDEAMAHLSPQQVIAVNARIDARRPPAPQTGNAPLPSKTFSPGSGGPKA